MLSQFASILLCFRNEGLQQNDSITKDNLLRLIIKMNGSFDEEVFNELWNECYDNYGEINQTVKIEDFVNVIYRSKHILNTRIHENKKNISDLNEIKRSLNTRYKVEESERTKQQILIDLDNVNKMIQQAYKTIKVSQKDFELIKKAFFKQQFKTVIRSSNKYQDKTLTQQSEDFDITSLIKTKQRILLALICLCLVLELLILHCKMGFVNVLSYTLILSFYCLRTIHKSYFSVNLLLLSFSILLDCIWLLLYYPLWYKHSPTYYYSLTFQRVTIVISSVLILIKCCSTVLSLLMIKPISFYR